MNRFQFAAVLLSACVVSPAHAKDEPNKFTHEGVSYTYTVTSLKNNSRLIEGRATPGSEFRLVVSGNQVSGKANGIPVSFRVKADKADADKAPNVTVASR